MDKLYRIAGFFPFVLIAFLNAFVDLGHKIVIQNTVFKIYDGETQIILTAIVNGLILLPFVLLFSPSGFISDRYRKPLVMKLSAAAAVVLTLLITLSYYKGWFEIAFVMTFLLAVQSAFYSPAKYGFIRELVGQERLAPMNAVVQATTMVAILSGVFFFSVLFEQGLKGQVYASEAELLPMIAPLGWVLVICSVIELILTFRLPLTHKPATEASFAWKPYFKGQLLKTNLKTVWSDQNIWLSIVGLSVFWGISQVVLASFPAFAKDVLGETNTVVIQGILACAGIGIVLGSLVAGKFSRHHIETGLVAVGAVGIVASLFAISGLTSAPQMALDILALGFFGGMFVVPLNSIIQFQAREEQLGTVLAGNNWVQNVVMLTFLGLTIAVARAGIDSLGLFNIITVIALAGAIYTIYHLPQSMIRFLVGRLFAGRYRIKVQGFENLPGQGGVLLLGNHVSWLDWAMVQIASPRPVRFVMHRSYYQRWYLKWFLNFFGVVPIARGHSKEALKQINALLNAGEVVCLFPEGAISRNGQLGEFKRGFEKAAEGADAVIVPFYLRGLWGSRFSRSSERMKLVSRRGLRRDIIVAFGPPISIQAKADEVKKHVFDLSIDAWQGYTETLEPLPLSWIQTVKKQGSSLCMTDALGDTPLTGYKALTASIAFAGLIKKRSPESNIGLLLPTSSAGMLTNMSILLLGKTVINLNYTASIDALSAAVDQAGIRTIYTSRRFIKKLGQKGIVLDTLLEKTRVCYLEDLKDEVTGMKKLFLYTLVKVLPAQVLYTLFGKRVSINDPAAILFSSGSEGSPKGVVLSHRNIMGNIKQVSDVLDIQENDAVMGSLPQFHAFGLTVTGLLPLVEGIPAVFHPDPTDVLNIAKAISRFKVTVLCGTSTFLRLYVRNNRVHPLMLESLRIVVSGAERLNPEVRAGFEEKFRKPVYEGYGTTETTPVAGVNIPDRLDTDSWHVQTGSKPGTVGLPLPGSSFKIVDPDTMQPLPSNEDGLILIGGTQVMLGYLNDPEKTRESIVEIDGHRWYKSGDKGHLDEDGFLTIVDRYSRFAKIGGEMISLGAIEESLAHVIPEEVEVLATAIPDGKKGEKVVLLFSGEIDESSLTALIADANMPPLMRPARLVRVDAIPKLGTGKSDFRRAKSIALEAAG
ncbi:MAG TPA: acyl-[ACP]--phospholipid O-acyltransferase [Gammaproteobacteria bacterium]|nr:acyl-[ACP]--phospholipid O-acyltransferase [Gammaproteobacteria bacterium]